MKYMMKQFFENTRPWGQLVALVLLFVLFFILFTGLTLTLRLAGVQADLLVLQAASQLVCFGLTAVVFAWMFYGQPMRYLRFGAEGRMGWRLLGAFLLLLCLLPFSDWTTQLNDGWHLPQRYAALEEQLRSMGEQSEALVEVFLLRDGAGALVANLLVLALVPALCEEMLFRGVLQQVLCRAIRNPHVAIWLTAALFSLFHGEVFAFLPRFVLGLALGYVFYYGRSIWYGVLLHFANNATVVVLYRAAAHGWIAREAVESFNSPWPLALLSLLLSVALLYLFFVRHRVLEKEAGACDGKSV